MKFGAAGGAAVAAVPDGNADPLRDAAVATAGVVEVVEVVEHMQHVQRVEHMEPAAQPRAHDAAYQLARARSARADTAIRLYM